GWLFHLNTPDDLLHVEPGMAELGYEKRETYLRHVERRVVPVVVSSVAVRSRLGSTVRLDAILVPLTAGRIRQLLDTRAAGWLRGLVQRGIDLARQTGCRLVSLGQYTSIVMRNGTAVRLAPIGVTTGNVYAVALTLGALQRAVPDLARCTVAVVGATGNIGAALANLLSVRCARLILVGRDRHAR